MSVQNWRPSSFLLAHGLLIPASLIVMALLSRVSGWDEGLTALFFDPAIGDFPARQSASLEDWGHRWAKSAVLGVWLLLLLAAMAALWFSRLRPHRKLLWLTVLGMSLGPAVVAVLKDINAHPCPWDLKAYGGALDYTADWFVPRSQAGRCFPGGHAAGGFSVLALAFAAISLGWAVQARWLLVLAVLMGLAFSVIRIVQGAHFLSHNLWSAAIVWALAAWVMAPQMPRSSGVTLSRAWPASKLQP